VKERNWLYFAGWVCFRVLYKTYFRLRVCHEERVPRDGPAILASNHASFMDPPLVGASIHRDLHYLARATLFRFKPSGAVLRGVNCVPVDREGANPAGLKAIFDRLNAGAAVLLFPEGTRTRDGRLQAVRSGIGLITLRSSAPVVPTRIFGSFEALRKGQWFPRPARLVVKFGRPLAFEALRREAEDCSRERLKVIYRQAAEEIMAAIAALEPCVEKAVFP
jgi:1-acyl-sn-glycerol-3-phosphate acyltransferase